MKFMNFLILMSFVCGSVNATASTILLIEGNPTTGQSRELKSEASCPAGTQVIGGGCEIPDQNLIAVGRGDLHQIAFEYKLVKFGPDTNQNSFVCVARQLSGAIDNTFFPYSGSVSATASCLKY